MNTRLRNTIILALVFIIAAPIAMAVTGANGAIVVLSIVVVFGFFMVVFMGVIGSMENEAHPQAATDSHAVAAWKTRLGDTPKAQESSDTAS